MLPRNPSKRVVKKAGSSSSSSSSSSSTQKHMKNRECNPSSSTRRSSSNRRSSGAEHDAIGEPDAAVRNARRVNTNTNELAMSTDPAIVSMHSAMVLKKKKKKKHSLAEDPSVPSNEVARPKLDRRHSIHSNKTDAATILNTSEVIPQSDSSEHVAVKVDTPIRVYSKKKVKDKDRISMEKKRVMFEEREREERDTKLQEEADMKIAKITANKVEEGDYEDDDFEDYEDDAFEDDKVQEPVFKSTSKSSTNAFAPDVHSFSKNKTVEEKTANVSNTRAGKFKKMEKVRPLQRHNTHDSILQGDLEDLDTLDNVGIQVESQSILSERVAAIKSRITLQQCRIDVFEQHSLLPWEFYIRTVGAGGSHRQRFVQTNDDALDATTQSEPVEQASFTGQGDECVQINLDEEGVDSAIDRVVFEGKYSSATNDNEARFNNVLKDDLFPGLEELTGICEVLLEEGAQYRRKSRTALVLTTDEDTRNNCERTEISDSGFTLDGGEMLALQNRSLIHLHFSQTQAHILLSAHSRVNTNSEIATPEDPVKRLALSSVLVLWDLSIEARRPVLALACSSDITRCILSPWQPHLAVAGCEDGTLFVWDLRDHLELLSAIGGVTRIQSSLSAADIVYPSYCTYVPPGGDSMETAHGSEICDMQVVRTAGSTSSSFQLVSLDHDGHVHVWTVLDHSSSTSSIAKANSSNRKKLTSVANGEEGVNPGLSEEGRVKLYHADHLHAFALANNTKQPRYPQGTATSVCMHRNDAGQVLVTTSSGVILHCTRFGDAIPPREYIPGPGINLPFAELAHVWDGAGLAATCVAFNPLLDTYFCAGFSSGAFALYHTSNALPIKVWQMSTESDLSTFGGGFAAVRHIEWSNDSPSVLFVADDVSLYVWDFARDGTRPIATARGIFEAGKISNSSTFALSSSIVRTIGSCLAAHNATKDGIEVYFLNTKTSPPRAEWERRLQKVSSSARFSVNSENSSDSVNLLEEKNSEKQTDESALEMDELRVGNRNAAIDADAKLREQLEIVLLSL